MSKRATKTTRLPLPWERWRTPLRLSGGRRFKLPLAVLSAVGVAVVAHQVGSRRAELGATRAMLTEVRRATRSFVNELGRCPEDTNELVHPPKSGTQYLHQPPLDAWGRAPQLHCELGGDKAVIEALSAGPSGSFLDGDNVM